MPFWVKTTESVHFETSSSNSYLLLALKERYLVPILVVSHESLEISVYFGAGM